MTSQYETIRTESGQARSDQQSIINWNQAFAVALFAVGIVIVGNSEHMLLAQVLFGLLLPLVLVGGTMAWAGEMIRMERAGAYLRALERAMWHRLPSGQTDPLWFMWENFLWSPPKRMLEGGYKKQNAGYAGIAIFYGAMYVGSLAVFASISPAWLTVVVSCVIVVISSVTVLPVARQIFSLGGIALTISDEDLRDWATNILERRSIAEQGVLFRHGESLFSFVATRLRRVAK